MQASSDKVLWTYDYKGQRWEISEYRGRKHSGILITGTLSNGLVFFNQDQRYQFLGYTSHHGTITEASIQEHAKQWIVTKGAPRYAEQRARKAKEVLSPLISKTDPKRPRKHINERNDCTVVALSLACQISYDRAHRIAVGCGRKANRGFQTVKLLNAGGFAFTEHKIDHWVRPALTIGAFVTGHATGHYILETRTHAMAVIDGKIYDDKDYTRKHVFAIYEIL